MALILFFFTALFAFAQEPHRCAACHVDVVSDFKTHEHSKRGMDCAICHGASESRQGPTIHQTLCAFTDVYDMIPTSRRIRSAVPETPHEAKNGAKSSSAMTIQTAKFRNWFT